jgi:uncharacterized protein YrrD
MRKARSLLGLNVIAQAGGESLGGVRDLLFDSQSSELLAVVLSEKDLFGLIQAQVVPWREVVKVGPNAIIVQSAASKIKAGDDDRLSDVVRRETTLGGTRIMTTDGQDVGTLADVYIDVATGRVAGYEISSGFLSDTLRGKRFMPAVENVQMGKDVAFVPPEAATQMEQRAWQPGSWQHGTVAAGERFSHLAGNVRTKAESLYDNMATASADKQEQWVTGRIAARDVRLPSSGPAGSELEGGEEFLVRAGEVITPEAARRARELGQLGNLAISAIEGAATSAYNSGKEKLTGPAQTHPTDLGEDSTVQPSTTQSASSNPLETVQAKAAAAALGQRAGRTVLRPDGSALIEPGEVITDLVMTEARQLGKENEVIAAAGLGAAHAGFETAKEQATTLWSSLKEKAEEFGGSMQNKRTDAEEAALQKRLAAVAGQRSTRLILDRNDQPIVSEGEIITHAAIQRAREAGALDVLLNSVEEASWPPPQPIVVEETIVVPETQPAGKADSPSNSSLL